MPGLDSPSDKYLLFCSLEILSLFAFVAIVCGCGASSAHSKVHVWVETFIGFPASTDIRNSQDVSPKTIKTFLFYATSVVSKHSNKVNHNLISWVDGLIKGIRQGH